MSIPCPSCGVTTADGEAFCEACGSSLTNSAATPATGASADPTAADTAGRTATSSDPAPTEYLPGEGSSNVVSTTVACVSCGGGPITDSYCDVCGTRQPDPRDHFEETPSSWVAGVCDKGIVHARNEDAMSTASRPDPGSFAVLVVCDGVTTAPLSERASLAAANAARQVLVDAAGDFTNTAALDWHDALKRSCAAAQTEAVAVAATLTKPTNPPSCTFVVGVIVESTLYTGWCGDSRAYWLPDNGDAIVVSVDDSIASQMIAAGTLRSAAEADSRAHTITRWLGADAPDPTAHTLATPMTANGWVAVVSDGMWNYVSDPTDFRARLTGYVEPGATPLSVAKHMVAWANEQGGHDNISVALARIGELAPATEQAETVPSANAEESLTSAEPPAPTQTSHPPTPPTDLPPAISPPAISPPADSPAASAPTPPTP